MLRRAVITTLLTHQTVSTFSVRPRPYKLTQMSTFTSASKGSLGSGKNDVDEMLQGLQTYTEGAAGATTTAEERDEAAKMRSGGSGVVDCNTRSGGGDSCGPNTPSDPDLPPVQIDPEGTFKYVLISATAPAGGPVRYLVRGNQRAAYHKDAARPTLQILESKGWSYTVLGGGRIRHDPAGKAILVYGFSYGFPWQGEPRHDISVAVLKEAYPDYTIESSNEGY